MKPRKQYRVDQLNQLSKTTPTYARRASQAAQAAQAVLGSSTGNAQAQSVSPPTISEDSGAAVTFGSGSGSETPIQDPLGAESPQFSATSRAASSVSLTALSGSGLTKQASLRARATTLDVPGLTRSKVSPDGRIAKRDVGAKLIIVMVGLPARGKSYITKKLCRFLNWQQHDAKLFNVGNTRRRANAKVGPAQRPLPDCGHNECATESCTTSTSHAGDFFSPDNQETVALREQWAEDTLHELLDYVLDGDGSVGILDATNTTVARRKAVLDIIKQRSDGRLSVLFLESVCTDPKIIESNVKLKLSGPDYKNMDKKAAMKDFMLRLRNYEKAYEPIGVEEEDQADFQYIKMINVGQKVECGNIKGFLACQTVFFLLNFNLADRQIWITRHGESTDNQMGRIGGDAPLTERGRQFSQALTKFMEHKKQAFRRRQLAKAIEKMHLLELDKKISLIDEPQEVVATNVNRIEERNFCVWTSMLRRAIETAEYFDDNEFDLKEFRMLNELDAGICDGMTYQEIKEQYPAEYRARMEDKIRYRYPGVGGESYLDVINRLRPVIMEMERMEDNCLVICHRVVARVLLAYFMNLGRDAIGDLEVPLHTLYVLEPQPYGVDWALYKYNERFNWFYKVPKEAADVKDQLGDRNRRYTVVATAGIDLGDTRSSSEVAIADDEDENSTNHESDSENENDRAAPKQVISS